MKNPVWTRAVKSSADPARVRHLLDVLEPTEAGAFLKRASAEQARVLAALFSGSRALGNTLVAHPDWIVFLELDRLRFPRRKQGLQNDIRVWLESSLETGATAFGPLRDFKQREMLRIAARDLARLGDVSEITREISDVADVCLSAVGRICFQQAIARFGSPWHQDAAGHWQRTGFCVLGMGKLGGQELNYSSDVDVLFVYSDEGQVFKDAPVRGKNARSVMAGHSFFNRLAETFIAEVSRLTPEGMLYRIDLRLRPEGDAGPLCRSMDGYENYYAQWGQTWERMMLIKGRVVAGDEALGSEFFEIIQPFRYPRAISGGVMQEVGAMKDRIENEVLRTDERERNVKLGRGGIREIEFIVQMLQLLHAGREPFLQGPQTLATLEKLAQYHWLSPEDARALRDAYRFLRDVEHRLQMEENLQTHTIPNDGTARQRLARLMGFRTAAEFERARQMHTDRVRGIFDVLLESRPKPESTGTPFPRSFSDTEAEWKAILAEHSFRDPEKAFHVLREFVEGPGYVHVSSRTAELAHQLLPASFALCPKVGKPQGERRRSQGRQKKNDGGGRSAESRPPASDFRSLDSDSGGRASDRRLSDPDRVITRLDSFISAYGGRAVLFELWNSNPAIFEMLLLLFDRSEFLAELAIRTPDLLDDLVTSGRLRLRKAAAETLRDLRHGLNDADQRLWLRRYHQAEIMRIGLRDILGLANAEQYLTELSALADACLQYALEVVLRKHRMKSAPVAIIGLGKLGGAEIDYGSDLDLLFVASPKSRNLPRLQSLALEVMELVSTRTEMGIVFHTDARLRPDGEKGLLVNTLDAYENYYRERAHLWEIQSLSRTRPVAGDGKVGEAFQKLAGRLSNFKKPSLPLEAYSSDWKQGIHRMRLRIEKERTPAGKDELAIKTGKGGLMDAEFVAQTLCLDNGWQEANTLSALERGRAAGILPAAERLIQNYRQLRRVEATLRRWSYEGETVLPDDPAPYYRVAVRCGFPSPDAFRKALALWRRAIREVYSRVFPF